MKRIDVDTTLEFLDLIGKVFKVANVQSVSGLEERSSIMALKERLAIYDAAYLCVAMKNKSALVTDDGELRKKALKYIEAIKSSELASRYAS